MPFFKIKTSKRVQSKKSYMIYSEIQYSCHIGRQVVFIINAQIQGWAKSGSSCWMPDIRPDYSACPDRYAGYRISGRIIWHCRISGPTLLVIREFNVNVLFFCLQVAEEFAALLTSLWNHQYKFISPTNIKAEIAVFFHFFQADLQTFSLHVFSTFLSKLFFLLLL